MECLPPLYFNMLYISICSKVSLLNQDTQRLPLCPQNSNDAATSRLPPAASSVLIAISRVAPSPINVAMSPSECRLAVGRGAGARLCAATEARGGALDVGPDNVCPPLGKEGVAGGWLRVASAELVVELDPAAGRAAGSSSPESIIRALSGSSCSDKKRTSRFWIRRTFFSRSIHA